MSTDPKRSLGDDEVSVSAVFRSSFPLDIDLDGFRTKAWSGGLPRREEELKPLYRTLLHALSAAAKLSTDQGIRLLPDDEDEAPQFLSYAELYRRAMEVAGGLQQKGFAPGDRAMIVMPTSFEFFIAFFAVQAAGGIPVPSYPPAALEKVELALERLQHVATHAEVKVCLTTRPLLTLLGGLAMNVPSLQVLTTLESLPTAKISKVVPRSEDPAFIQYTSGSTGRPKGVLLTQRNLVSNIHAIGQVNRINRTDVVVSWLPQYHDMGLIGGVLYAVYWRIPVVLLSPMAFLMRPVRWLQAISTYRGTLTAAPNFAYALCVKRVRPRDLEGLDLSSWRLGLNGAEPVNVQTLRDFAAKFATVGFKASTLYPVYGLAESTVGVTFPDMHRATSPRGGGEKLAALVRYLTVDRAALAAGRVEQRSGPGSVSLVSVGRPLPGHEVWVVDDRGRPVGERVVGHVVTRGPSVMKGYFRDQAATDKVLRDGCLWTGDLGFVDTGELFIAGRAKDLIIVRGKNFYAEDLEHVVERIDGTRGGGVVAFSVYDEEKANDLVVLVCETTLEDDAARQKLATAITEAVSESAGLTLDEVVLVPPGTIPKTSSGKRQRGQTRQAYLENALTPKKTGPLKLAWVFVRSSAGRLSLWSKRLGKRREPD
ncbi:MAG: fatty acyl-AMP ligase [Archangium sp.]|nr:fatty acyl-AMP ligase [Archangium sp.]